MNELALFAGHGGGILGGKLLGWKTVCAVEFDPYARRVLAARQDDGCLDPFPIWDDVRTFDGKPWAGLVDVVSGGFPCQDISCAGKGAGIDGAKSGLWVEMARIICEVRPRFVFVENSPMLTSRGLGRVLGDLAAMGYDAAWGVLGAVDAGAPHKRDRIWITAHATDSTVITGNKRGAEPAGQLGAARSSNGCDDVADTMRDRPQGAREDREAQGSVGLRDGDRGDQEQNIRDSTIAGFPIRADKPMGESSTITEPERSNWWSTEPDVGRVAHGVASRVDRLRGIGNGQVPAVAALAFQTLTARLLSALPNVQADS
jgi:DNA (cytosine-5)-methyltransferase 1